MNDRAKTTGFGPQGTVYRTAVAQAPDGAYKADTPIIGNIDVSRLDVHMPENGSLGFESRQVSADEDGIIGGLGLKCDPIKVQCGVDNLYIDSKLIEDAKIKVVQPKSPYSFEPVKLADNDPMQDYFNDGDGNLWSIARLVEMTADLPVIEVPIQALNISSQPWDGCNMLDLAFHVRNVMDADLDKPIILDWLGRIADGRHRIIKSIIQGKSTIKCVRMYWRPAPDKTA